MFKRNKQKGFISAELGIGILVISLLTIMGFLAASDLDDEISRSPEKNTFTPSQLGNAYIDSLLALQDGMDNGQYSHLYKPDLYPNVIAENLGMLPMSSWHIHGSGAHIVLARSQYEIDANLYFKTTDSKSAIFEIVLYQSICSKYIHELKSRLPNFLSNTECKNGR